MAKNFFRTFLKTLKSFLLISPILIGIILFIGLFNTFVPQKMIIKLFTGTDIIDGFIGSSIGSVFTGNPITSYIIGGELIDKGVSLFAVTAFIIAWVTVGIVQFPAEAAILGKQFALRRNILSFFLSIIVALCVTFTLSII